MLKGTLRNRFGPEARRGKVWFRYVNPDYVAREKARAGGGVPFVSTNDVISSWFLRGWDLGTMAVNFRGRVPGCGDADAGNFESFVTFTGPQFGDPDAGAPAKVRQALAGGRFRRVSAPGGPPGVPIRALPTPREAFGRPLGIITNWASFHLEPRLEGCAPELHLPLYDVSPGEGWGLNLGRHNAFLHNPFCVVFRADGRLAVMLIGFDDVMGPASGRLDWGADSLLGAPLDVPV